MFFGCKNINFSYGNTKILQNINIEFEKGEFTGLVGDNGSGKSTLMKIISGIFTEYDGEVFFKGENLDDKSRIKVGYIFQNPENQIVGVTVEEDVAFGLENIGVEREEMLKKIKWALEVVGLKGLEKSDPNALSGGQKQRLAIASIVAMEPEIILMDEPTTMLDPVGRREVYKVIKRLVNLGKTIIIASHHSDDLEDVSRIIALKEGKVHFDGTRDDFYKHNDFNIEYPIEFEVKKHTNKDYEELVKYLGN
ncbi:MAG: energy-coupling factor ABC transporter ATP-binding protein [Thermotogota bacterium]